MSAAGAATSTPADAALRAAQADLAAGGERQAALDALAVKRLELKELHHTHSRAGGGTGSGRWKHADMKKRAQLEHDITLLTAELDLLTEQLLWRTRTDQLVAFAIGTHMRLGAGSEERLCAVQLLGGCCDVLRCIAAHVRAA